MDTLLGNGIFPSKSHTGSIASAIVLDVAADVVVVTHRDEEEIALIHKE